MLILWQECVVSVWKKYLEDKESFNYGNNQNKAGEKPHRCVNRPKKNIAFVGTAQDFTGCGKGRFSSPQRNDTESSSFGDSNRLNN